MLTGTGNHIEMRDQSAIKKRAPAQLLLFHRFERQNELKDSKTDTAESREAHVQGGNCSRHRASGMAEWLRVPCTRFPGANGPPKHFPRSLWNEWPRKLQGLH
jgi:hypothetical protein